MGKQIFIWHLQSERLELLGQDRSSGSLDEVTSSLPGGAYTTFSTVDSGQRVVGLTSHLARLQYSASQAGWKNRIPLGVVRSALWKVVGTISPTESRIRLILDTSNQIFTLYILQEQLIPLPEQVYREGVKVLTCSLQRESPDIKHTGFIHATQVYRKGRSAEVHEIILVTGDYLIMEGMTSNFYVVLDGCIYTAGEGVLSGVTRQVILELAHKEGIPIEFKPPDLRKIRSYSEAFLTSSSRGVVPVIQVDDIIIGAGMLGQVTQQLIRLYQEYQANYAEQILI